MWFNIWCTTKQTILNAVKENPMPWISQQLFTALFYIIVKSIFLLMVIIFNLCNYDDSCHILKFMILSYVIFKMSARNVFLIILNYIIFLKMAKLCNVVKLIKIIWLTLFLEGYTYRTGMWICIYVKINVTVEVPL